MKRCHDNDDALHHRSCYVGVPSKHFFDLICFSMNASYQATKRMKKFDLRFSKDLRNVTGMLNRQLPKNN